MIQNKNNMKVDYACKGILSIIDLVYPVELLENPKSRAKKYILRKNILDLMHEIEFLEKQVKEE